MVALENVPPGEDGFRQVGLFHHLWLAGFLLICSLVAFQPGSTQNCLEFQINQKKSIGSIGEMGKFILLQDPTAEVLVTGDIMLGRGVAWVDDPFSELSQLLTSADLTVGNFEGVISSQESSYHAAAESNRFNAIPAGCARSCCSSNYKRLALTCSVWRITIAWIWGSSAWKIRSEGSRE